MADGLTNINGTLYFDGESDAVTGDELWKSDGTTAGTTMIKDLNPNPGLGIGAVLLRQL